MLSICQKNVNEMSHIHSLSCLFKWIYLISTVLKESCDVSRKINFQILSRSCSTLRLFSVLILLSEKRTGGLIQKHRSLNGPQVILHQRVTPAPPADTRWRCQAPADTCANMRELKINTFQCVNQLPFWTNRCEWQIIGRHFLRMTFWLVRVAQV